MRLADLIARAGLPSAGLQDSANVTGFAIDNRKVAPGTVLSRKSYTAASPRSTALGTMLPPMSCLLPASTASWVRASIKTSVLNT